MVYLAVVIILILAFALFKSVRFSFAQSKKINALELEIYELKTHIEEIKAPEMMIKPVSINKIKPAIQPSHKPNAIGLDSTKIKSRQPSNSNVVPQGFKEVMKQVDGDVIALLERIHPTAFTYKFFGSTLIVDDKSVISGLTPRLHIVEVDEEGRFYVDNQEMKVHPDVIESLRNVANTRE